MTWVFVAVLSFILIVFLSVVFIYNALVRKDKMVQEAWSGIDVQLKRRHDLIPQLVDTVKIYAKYEKETLEAIVAQRSICQKSEGIEAKSGQENILSGMLHNLFALVEQYPNLKANENFLKLQGSIEHIEDELQMARRYYNATVREYNTFVEVFPSNLVAQYFKFMSRNFFEMEA